MPKWGQLVEVLSKVRPGCAKIGKACTGFVENEARVCKNGDRM